MEEFRVKLLVEKTIVEEVVITLEEESSSILQSKLVKAIHKGTDFTKIPIKKILTTKTKSSKISRTVVRTILEKGVYQQLDLFKDET
jgi:hypothetical protein